MGEDGLQRLRAGEAEAVDRLYRAHAGTVLGWVIRLGAPMVDPEDTAQEVFAVALGRLSAIRGDNLLAWLYGITRRVVANARRRAAFRRFLHLDAAPEPVSEHPHADAALEQHRRRRLVQDLLETLPFEQREVLVLVDLEERAAPEVAVLLGVPVGTVYSRLHRARRAFAAALASTAPARVALAGSAP